VSGFSDEIKLISKQQYEAQLQHIFRLLLENKSQEEIARELHISTRTVARYFQRIEKRYGQMQREKTDNTLFLEYNLLKNRLLTLYKALENQVVSDNKTSGTEKAKCAEVAANIAIDVLKMESEGIKAVKEGLLLAEKAAAATKISKTTNSTINNNNMVLPSRDMMMDDDLEESC
jgi:DNA invertase Pin-like site-specific DNA recombinase